MVTENVSGGRLCATCAHAGPMEVQPGGVRSPGLECRRYPPSVFLVPSRVAGAASLLGVYPPCLPSPCGEYASRVV